MSDYKRFITYLFRYVEGEKLDQVGYAKVELRQNVGRIDIRTKGCRDGLAEVRPYFFARGVRVPIGTLTVKNGMGEGSFKFDCTKLGDTEYGFQDIRGLLIPVGTEEVLFSQWDDERYDWSELVVEVKEPEKEELRQQSIKPQESLEQRLQSLRPKMYPFQGDFGSWAIQAQPRDIRCLPKECWRLGNNSFVMRGYFNYGRILIGYMEEKQSWFIGVPGVFCKQEQVIAGMFGFGSFRGQTGGDEKPGEFGYWYQLLNVV